MPETNAGTDRVVDLAEYSDRVLRREHQRLGGRIRGLHRRIELHRQLLEEFEVQMAVDQRLLTEIEELMDLSPQLRLERLDRQLRGQRLREIAVEVLQRADRAEQPVHYREWFALVQSAGYEIGGRNPLATFLVQVSRARGVERVGQRTGLYRVTAG
jgi:hypothetical protein